MTNLISTTESSAAKPDSKTQPGPRVAASQTSLESCINARRAELSFKLAELRASMHLDAMEAGDRIKATLSELAQLLKGGPVDGWASVGDTLKRKLDRWLADSARELAAAAKSATSW